MVGLSANATLQYLRRVDSVTLVGLNYTLQKRPPGLLAETLDNERFSCKISKLSMLSTLRLCRKFLTLVMVKVSLIDKLNFKICFLAIPYSGNWHHRTLLLPKLPTGAEFSLKNFQKSRLSNERVVVSGT